MDEKLQKQIKVHRAKLEQLFARLQRIYELSKNVSDPKVAEQFSILYPRVSQTISDYEKTELVVNELELELDEDFVVAFNDSHLDLLQFIEAAANTLKPKEAAVAIAQSSAAVAANSQPVVSESVLPKIDLPKFDGNQTQWSVFYELFKALVHDNKNLNDQQKVQYLVSRLTGQAANICRHLPPLANNYQIIWEALLTRYNDPRAQVEAYFKQIFEFRPIKSESKAGCIAILDGFCSSINALKRLQLTDLSDSIFLYHGLRLLDPSSRRNFELAVRDKVMPNYDDFVKFIEKQIKTLPSEEKQVESFNMKHKKDNKSKVFVVQSNDSSNDAASKNPNCLKCSKPGHRLVDCASFLKMTPWDRYCLIKGKFCCFRCLDVDHLSKNCRSKTQCAQCRESHHSLLHFSRSSSNEGVASSSNSKAGGTPPISCCSTSNDVENSTVVLSTVTVHVRDCNDQLCDVRFLVDTGSQCHFVTAKLCRRLRLPFRPMKTVVRGFGGGTSEVRGRTCVSIQSKLDPTIKFSMDATVVDKIIDKLPSCEIDKSKLHHLENLTLADDKFYLPSRIDGIIGAELVPHLLRGSPSPGESHELMTVNSVFGHILMGRAPILTSTTNASNCFTAICSTSLDSFVERFWELESCPAPSCQLKPEELECEEDFRRSVRRVDSGRFVVSLSFAEPPSSLGDSYAVAERRLLTLERRLELDSNIRIAYHEILLDYLRQGHMSLVADQADRGGYYMPHHAIVKASSTTTPIRIVFDAGSRTSSGLSLNQVLHAGPKLQTDIFVLLVNFRLFPIALTADIKQMYRQILVEDSCRRYQRVLWRFSREDPVEIYQLNCVVFGVSSSPYLALRTVHQLVEEDGDCFPAAKARIPRDMFMDDLVTSVATESEAAELHRQSKQLFEGGGFLLTKWTSNSPSMLEKFSEEEKSFSYKDFEADNSLTILGLNWQPSTDLFQFSVKGGEVVATKRSILSVMARIYDPLGLLSPFTLFLKCLVQKLWKLGVDWDEKPPESICTLWENCQKELPLLLNFAVPRHVGLFQDSRISLIGFCDASLSGFGAVIYVKSQIESEEPRVVLLCSKSKVAPTKVVSIPRLELCAALLLAELMNSVVSIISERCHVSRIVALSDSTVTLCWINAPSAKWQTFVGNRVAKIQDSCIEGWMHVAGIENPADCLSRGLSPGELVNFPLWLSGPSWMAEDECDWPVRTQMEEIADPPEAKKPSVLIVAKSPDCNSNAIYSLIGRCSDYGRLLRIVILVLKFLRILPQSEESDLDVAERYLCKVVQKIHFSSEFVQLEKGEDCSMRLRRLSPFIDKGVIRVGGRLSHAGLEFENCHQMILPKSDVFVSMLIDYHHKKNCHAGPSLLLSLIRQKFWILSARSIIRICVFKCNRCFRTRPSNNGIIPKMGDLPACRVSQCKPFENCGVDYAGPLRITMARRRNPCVLKAYICLFVCMATKAVHIELVSDLSTPMFLAAFRRFLSRRGPCRVMYSDCGTNFVGANEQLRKISQLLNSSEFQTTLTSQLAEYRIDWKFIPPGSPHFGGLWEANVKSVKLHLFRVIGNQLLTYEELNTVLVQIEGVLNSRPLCVQSADPSEPMALTPAHFLTLTPLKSFPMRGVDNIPVNRLTRYELVNQLIQSFWNRWRREYLHELQSRKKWLKSSTPISVGTVVVVDQPNLPPLQWPLGVIEQVFPGSDGAVRVASVRVKNGIFKRPVTKLYPLPTQ